jgi:glycosyltransferase involved in cell wall biosynthesis
MPSLKRFSIVLPVRNGGEHLKLATASILNQTLADDFELLILENFSTDGTAEWLASLPDSRVRVHPADKLLSIEENWARILRVPRGEFMTIIGHDDLLDADYLATMNALVEEHPDAGLYQAHFRLIDSAGRFLRHCLPMPARETAAEFLAARLTNIRDTYGTGYLMRTADYDRVGGIPLYDKLMYADDSLWLRLMEGSWKATSPHEVFSYRLHGQSTSGGIDPAAYLSALERHQQALEMLAQRDPAVAHVLLRYAPPAYASCAQYLDKRFLLRSAAGKGEYPPAIAERVQGLARPSAGANTVRMQRQMRLRLLEWACRLPGGRWLYRLAKWSAGLVGQKRRFID